MDVATGARQMDEDEWMNTVLSTAGRAQVNAVCRRNQHDISAISLFVMRISPLILPFNSTFAAQSAPVGSIP